VIGADSQISAPGYYKYHESKVGFTHGQDWALLFGYAGDPGLYQQARNAIAAGLRDAEERTVQQADLICRGVLDGMGWPYQTLDLKLLIGVSCQKAETRLLVFDGKSLNWGSGMHVVGVGDSSLSRYLSDTLYESAMTVDEGVRIATYMISRAKSYIDHCGGETVLYAFRDLQKPEHILPAEVQRIETEMLAREKQSLKAIVGLE